MKEILEAVKEMQKDPSVKGGETALIIPSLERLVNVNCLLLELFDFIEVVYILLTIFQAWYYLSIEYWLLGPKCLPVWPFSTASWIFAGAIKRGRGKLFLCLLLSLSTASF